MTRATYSHILHHRHVPIRILLVRHDKGRPKCLSFSVLSCATLLPRHLCLTDLEPHEGRTFGVCHISRLMLLTYRWDRHRVRDSRRKV